jgi:hypothetical protein
MILEQKSSVEDPISLMPQLRQLLASGSRDTTRWRHRRFLPQSPGPSLRRRGLPHLQGRLPLLNLRADKNEEQAIALRTKADALETEAKRLREAADTLAGGPDGQA